MIYNGLVREMIVMNVCINVYVSGYANALDDCSSDTKKTVIRNFANMAGSTCSGVVTGVLFPIYIPTIAVQLAYTEFQRRR